MATGVSRIFRRSGLAFAWLVAVLVVSGCVQTVAAPETTGVTQPAGANSPQAAPATTGSTATLAGPTPTLAARPAAAGSAAALTPAAAAGTQQATPVPDASSVVSTTAAATGTPQATAMPAASQAVTTTAAATGTPPATAMPAAGQAVTTTAAAPGMQGMAMPATSQAVSMTAASDVLYQADFTNPKSGWPDELQYDKYYVGYHEPDSYEVQVHEQNDSAIAPVPGRTFDNFAVESELMVNQPNTAPEGDFRYGLAFRRTGSHYYAFAISPKTKTWFVLKSTGSSVEVLAKGSSDTMQGLQSPDTLRINALGPDLTFFIDGKPVSQLKDADFTSGELGLYVETFDSPKAHIHFQTLVVRKPEDPEMLYQADFTNPKSGWPDELAFDKYYVGYHEPDFYHVEVHEQNDSAIAPVPGRTFGDFAAESDILVSKANTAPEGDFRYGLAFRRTGSHYYAFVISPRTKTWYVLKSTGSSVEVLAKGSSDSIQGLQALDNLRINALGPGLTFFLNGKQVGQLNDADFTSGELGLYVETVDSPKAHIHYHSLIVRKPDSTLAQSAAQALTCQVRSAWLNLRRGPGVSFAPLVGLFAGTQLTPLGRSADQQWIQVRVQDSGQQGWVSALSPYVTCNAPIANLPVSQ